MWEINLITCVVRLANIIVHTIFLFRINDVHIALHYHTLSANPMIPNLGTGLTHKEGRCSENELDVNIACLDSVNASSSIAFASFLCRGKEMAMTVYSLGIYNFNHLNDRHKRTYYWISIEFNKIEI